MTQLVKRKWGLLGWRVLFISALILLQEWAFAALAKPSFMDEASGKGSQLSLAISFSRPQPEPTQGKTVNSLPAQEALRHTEPKPETTADRPVPKEEVTKAPVVANKVTKKTSKPAITQHVSKEVLKPSSVLKNKSEALASTSVAKVEPSIKQVNPDAKTVEPSSVQTNSDTQSLTDLEANPPHRSISDQMEVSEQIITKPVFAAQPKPPRYPAVARKRGQEGTVWLDIWLDEKGNKSKLEVTQSSGLALLDKSALKAVSEWKFKPYERNGIRIASRVRIPVVFSLN